MEEAAVKWGGLCSACRHHRRAALLLHHPSPQDLSPGIPCASVQGSHEAIHFGERMHGSHGLLTGGRNRHIPRLRRS